MTWTKGRFCAASLVWIAAAAAPALAQDAVRAVSGRVALDRALTTNEAKVLAESLERRPAAQQYQLNPEFVRNRAETGNPVVIATAPPLSVAPDAPGPSPAPADAAPAYTETEDAGAGQSAPDKTLDIIRTSPRQEAQLLNAVAGQQGLRAMLAAKDSKLLTLPGILKMQEGDMESVILKPFVLVNRPLRRTAEGFEGELMVGVSEIGGTSQRVLPVPLILQIIGADRAEPADIELSETSPPFRRVKIALSAAADGDFLRIASPLDPGGTPIALPLQGALEIQAASGGIEGLGLATTRLDIMASGLPNPEGRRVALRVEPSGFLEETLLQLGPDGTASTTLRSDRIGDARILATSPGLASATTGVRFYLPYLTLCASVVGALLGAFIGLSTERRRRARPLVRLLGAAGFGVLVFALYVVGVNVLPVQPTVTVGAALVFAVSALAALLGPKAVTWRKDLVPA